MDGIISGSCGAKIVFEVIGRFGCSGGSLGDCV